MLTPDTAIDALGGTGAVSDALGLTPSIVSGWRTRGIPPGRWPELVKLAADKGCPQITFEALANAAPIEARA